MSIRSVQKQIRTALDDNKLTASEAQKIVETAEKGPITTGEAKQISNLYEDGQWVFPKHFPQGALPQPKPPEYELEPGAAKTLMNFFIENRVPQGETYREVKADIEATLANTNFYDSPMEGEPKGLKHLHEVFIRDQRPVDGNRVDAFVNTQKNEFYVHTTSARMIPTNTPSPEWFGPFALETAPSADPKKAVEDANTALAAIHGRMTEEVRNEDQITNLSLRPDGTVAVVVSPHANLSDERLLNTARELLTDAGMRAPTMEVVRPAIQPVPRRVMVANAMDALTIIQGRMTADVRAEDDITNLSLRVDGSVAVVVGPHANHSDADLLAAADKLLSDAGMKGTDMDVVRPAVDPIGMWGVEEAASDA